MRIRHCSRHARPTEVLTTALRGTIALALVGALASPARAVAQVSQAAKARASARATSSLKWGPAPAVFAPGATMAVVSGNPMSAGHYVVQLAMPSGYKIAPHYHPTDEHVKVMRGTFLVGMGDAMNLSKVKRLAAGDTITAPANMHHYAAARGRTVVEVSGMGPFKLTYVNPADMPKMTATAKP